MADIFISYASEERKWVEPLANALERHGFSVWWDTHIRAGETFDEVIERELSNAACVIVAWSKVSVTRRWVRTEANEAMERDVLIPILLDDVKPPLAFRLVQTENFVDWTGEISDKCWQRLILQVDALIARSNGQAVDPAPDLEKTPEAISAKIKRASSERKKTAKAPAKNSVWSVTRDFLFAGLLSVGLAFGLRFGLPAIGVGDSAALASVATAASIALLFYALFDIADREISPQMKSLASRWLLPVKGGVGVFAPEAFNNLFEAAFGRKHFSLKCLWRSAAASILFLWVMITLAYVLSVEEIHFGTGFDDSMNYLLWLVLAGLAFLVPNIVGDYISLFQTRLFLRYLKRNPNRTALIVILDFILTGAVYLTSLIILPPLIIQFFFNDALSLIPWANQVADGINTFFEAAGGQHKLNEDELVITLISFSAVLTTYMTSIWLWLVLALGPISRIFLWSRVKGPKALGRLFNVQQRPFSALGATVSILLLALGFFLFALERL